jgi:hypothetical protein
VPGLPSSKDDDSSAILFHRNDQKIIQQYHQGTESRRNLKPVVVVVSCKSARNALKDGKKATKDEIYNEMACEAPDMNFRWVDVLSTVEFKRTNRDMQPPPTTEYTVRKYNPPTQQYME